MPAPKRTVEYVTGFTPPTTKARRIFGLWRDACEAHTHCGLQRAGNEAGGQ